MRLDHGLGTTHGRRLALTAVCCVAGVAVTGCGSSVGPRLKRADKPFPAARRVSARVKAQEQVLHREVIARLHSPAPKYKPGVASFIPRSTTRINAVVTATRAHPQLAIAGDSVELHLAGGRVRATMNGPLYNNKLVGTNDPTVPARFLVAFTSTHGTIPLAPKDFTILDQLGHNIVPKIRVQGGGKLPKRLTAGKRLTLVMSTIISAGDGSIVYNPTGITRAGHEPLVGWDFIVEDD